MEWLMAIQSLPTTTVHQSHQPLALPTYPPIYTSSQLFFTSDNDGQKYHLIEEFRTHSLPLLLQHNAHVRHDPLGRCAGCLDAEILAG